MARPHALLLDVANGRPVGPCTDHEGLLASAVEHRMAGLLWERSDEVVAGAPPGWERALVARELEGRARNHALWDTLWVLAGRLGAAGVSVATAKGVTAESRWYGRIGARPCVDLDLLLDPADLAAADDVVALIDPGHPLLGQLTALVEARALSSVELRSPMGTPVDLHFDILKLGFPSRLRATIWDRTAALETGRGPVRVLDPESSVLLFLLHLNKDRFRTLLGHVDVARLLAREEVDWRALEAMARRDGVWDHVRLSLAAVSEVVDTASPALTSSAGLRPRLWRLVWRPSIRLRGDEGLVRFRHRQVVVGLLARGHFLEGVVAAFRRAVPRQDLLAYRHTSLRGPYGWQLLRTRARGLRRRLRDTRALRRAGSTPSSPGPAPRSGVG